MSFEVEAENNPTRSVDASANTDADAEPTLQPGSLRQPRQASADRPWNDGLHVWHLLRLILVPLVTIGFSIFSAIVYEKPKHTPSP
jgi:hypothetical protein|eukprot:SAG25_NODE_58_length_18473_cov_99.552846_5_plen_86_part_00